MRNTHTTRNGQKKVYQRDFNWIGTSRCTICSEYTSVVNIVATGKKSCGRCDIDLYKATGRLEKERWMKTGRR